MAYKDKRGGKHKGKWIAMWRVGTKPNGKPDYKRRYGFTREKDAKACEDEEKAKIALEGGLPATVRLAKVKDICKEYLDNRKDTIQISTFQNDLTHIDNHILPLLGNKLVIDIDYQTILKFRKDLLAKDLSNSRTNRIIGKFKSIYQFYTVNNGITKDPFLTLKNLKAEARKEPVFYDFKEFKKYISNCTDPIYYTLFSLLYYTGIRKGEALSLFWSDIDFDNKILNITKSVIQKVPAVPYKITNPKTRKSIRKIKLDVHTIKILKQHMNRQKEYAGFNLQKFVFGVNKPLSETTIYNRHKETIERANLKHMKIHGFRHSNASLLINNGADILLVSKRLGHSNIKMTLDTYAHLFPEKEDEVITLIDELED